MAPGGFGRMDLTSDLDDLAMVLEENMQLASHVLTHTATSTASSGVADVSVSSEEEMEASATVTAACKDMGQLTSLSEALAVSGFASMTLALSKPLPQTFAPATRTASAASEQEVSVVNVPSKNRTLASQQKCNAPIRVMSASKVAAQEVALPSSQVKSFRAAATNFTAFPDLLRAPQGYDFGVPRSVAGWKRAAIVWFRNDLRMHDNEVLASANNEALSVLPVFCFDPRDYGKSSSGFDKTGPYRAKFLVECVADLRASLRARGSDLVVRVGKPEEVLLQLAKAVGADSLYAHQEVTYEEVQAEQNVCASLQAEGVDCKLYWGSTLYHIDDLPFKTLDEMPANYGGFKEKTARVQVRPVAESPEKMKSLPSRGNVKVGDIPSLQDLGITASNSLDKAGQGPSLVGGETEALYKLASFVQEAKSQLKRSKESIMGANFSCKISPWLAMGCLSPRRMYQDLRDNPRGGAAASTPAEAAAPEGSNLNWLVFELLWRDFFRFITKKYGSTRKGANVAPAAAIGATA